jgi:phosphoglycolate phosphatase
VTAAGIPRRQHAATAIVFDLDGTLIDSVRDLATTASDLAVGLGGRALSLDEVSLMVGEGAGLLVKRALAAAGVDPETPGALARFLSMYQQRLLDTTVPYPGVPEALMLASRRARLSVLTNKPLAPSQRILEALGLAPYFERIIGGDGSFGRKPDPAALRELGSGAELLVLVGDSPIDAATAEAAGCVFVWARYGFGAARFDTPPDTPYVLDAAADLLSTIDRLERVFSGG